jgi:hypothetical protein
VSISCPHGVASDTTCSVCELMKLPKREDPVEICEVCGAEFQGLYHCQSIANIKPFDFKDLMHEEVPYEVVVSEFSEPHATGGEE